MKTPSIIVLILISLISTAHSAVWKTQNDWDDKWDQVYSDWVATQWTTDIFMDENRPDYYQVPHDCGDVSYFMRIIFAYEQKLPFVMKHPNRPSKLITNKTSEFDHHKAGAARFKAFLNFVSDVVSSKSLSSDTYPIKLKSIRVGDIYVAPGDHSYQIVDIDETGIPTLIASTTPRAVRHLIKRHGFPLFVPNDEENLSDGYRRFRNPEDIRKPMKELPDFSIQQYKMAKAANYNFVRFATALSQMLGTRQETPTEHVDRLVNDLCGLINERVNYVSTGLDHLQKIRQKNKQQCMTKAAYYHHSTFSRDLRLSIYFSQAQRTMFSMINTRGYQKSLNRLQAVFMREEPSLEAARKLDKECKILISPEITFSLNLRDVWRSIREGKLESDPHATLEQRWGISTDEYIPRCPTYGEG